MYLMFIFTSLEFELALSTISTILRISSIISLFIAASREDISLLRQEVSQGFSRIEDILKEILEEIKRR